MNTQTEMEKMMNQYLEYTYTDKNVLKVQKCRWKKRLQNKDFKGSDLSLMNMLEFMIHQKNIYNKFIKFIMFNNSINMPIKTGKDKGLLTTGEIRKLISAHNKLSKIVVPKGTNREGLEKLIKSNGYKINHKEQRLDPSALNRPPQKTVTMPPKKLTEKQKAKQESQKASLKIFLDNSAKEKKEFDKKMLAKKVSVVKPSQSFNVKNTKVAQVKNKPPAKKVSLPKPPKKDLYKISKELQKKIDYDEMIEEKLKKLNDDVKSNKNVFGESTGNKQNDFIKLFTDIIKLGRGGVPKDFSSKSIKYAQNLLNIVYRNPPKDREGLIMPEQTFKPNGIFHPWRSYLSDTSEKQRRQVMKEQNEVKKPSDKKPADKKPTDKKEEPTNTKKAKDLYETIKDRKWRDDIKDKIELQLQVRPNSTPSDRVVDAIIKGNKFTIFYYYTDDYHTFYNTIHKKETRPELFKRQKSVYTIPADKKPTVKKPADMTKELGGDLPTENYGGQSTQSKPKPKPAVKKPPPPPPADEKNKVINIWKKVLNPQLRIARNNNNTDEMKKLLNQSIETLAEYYANNTSDPYSKPLVTKYKKYIKNGKDEKLIKAYGDNKELKEGRQIIWKKVDITDLFKKDKTIMKPPPPPADDSEEEEEEEEDERSKRKEIKDMSDPLVTKLREVVQSIRNKAKKDAKADKSKVTIKSINKTAGFIAGFVEKLENDNKIRFSDNILEKYQYDLIRNLRSDLKEIAGLK